VLTNKIRTAIVAAVASCGLATAAAVPAVSQAQPNGSGGAKGCAVFHAETGTSEEVPDGTLIIALSGAVKQCQNGKWVTVAFSEAGGSLHGISMSAPIASMRL
jgi:hypothetical protein